MSISIRNRNCRARITLVTGMFVSGLAGCSGGGAGNSPVPQPDQPNGIGVVSATASATPASGKSPTPSPSPTPTVSPSLNGALAEFTSGTTLAGFTVTVGSTPDPYTCLNLQSATSMPCGTVGSPIATATTGPNGAFAMPNIPLGTYMITIGNGSPTYSTLHRTYTVTPGVNALGTLNVSQLSSDEQAWLADINNQRATVSYPISFANLVIDEYAEEQARAEAAAIANGTDPYGDSTEGIFCTNYTNSPGGIGYTAGVADLQPQASAYVAADNAWFGEKDNCPNGSWQGCTFADNTGHYINLSQTNDVWIGVGESLISYHYQSGGTDYGQQWAYDAVIPGDYYTSGPDSRRRARVASMLPSARR